MQIGYQQQSDQTLELLAARGDGDAFAELYDRHFDRVYDFVLRMVRDADEAADIAQETFLRAMKALKPGEKEASFSTWVFTIARNLALSRLDRKKKTVTFANPELADEEEQPGPALHLIDEHRLGNPEEAARASDLAKLVWDAVAFLNPKESSVLDLHLRQGLDSAEIAEVMGISKGNAYTILSRLKDNLEEAVVTLVMVRAARQKCQELDALLASKSGALLSPAVRRLVIRHVDACPACQEERKKLLSPASLFGAFAMVPIPLAVKQRIGEGLRQQWLVRGPSTAPGQAGESSGLQTTGSVHTLSSRLTRYPRFLGRFAMRQIRNFTVTWSYRTFGWKVLVVALFLGVLFGLGGGGALIAGTSGDSMPEKKTVAGFMSTPATSTPTPTPAPTAMVTAPPSPSPTPTLTPIQTPASPTTPAPTPPPPPPPSSTPALILEPASQCTPSAAGPLTGDAVEDATLADQLTVLTNGRRAERGLPDFVPDASLLAAARQHAQFVLGSRWWLDRGGSLIHCQPDGSDMYWRARCAGPPPWHVADAVRYGTVPCDGYPPAYVGENVAYGTVGRLPQQVFADMLTGEDPAKPEFVAMGLACYVRSDVEEYVCVQLMAGEPLVD